VAIWRGGRKFLAVEIKCLEVGRKCDDIGAFWAKFIGACLTSARAGFEVLALSTAVRASLE
jgi:hypothetical protein